MLVNALRKGDKVLLTDGSPATVECNKRGIIRTLTVPMFGGGGGTDTGSTYVDRIAYVLGTDGDGEPVQVPVTVTPKQQKALDNIHRAGF